MRYGDEKTVELYVDFLWRTIDYWKDMAHANKEEADYYRGIVDYLVEKGKLTLEEAITIGDELEDSKEGEE